MADDGNIQEILDKKEFYLTSTGEEEEDLSSESEDSDQDKQSNYSSETDLNEPKSEESDLSIVLSPTASKEIKTPPEPISYPIYVPKLKNEERVIQIQTYDGDVFPVPETIALMSNTIKSIVTALDEEQGAIEINPDFIVSLDRPILLGDISSLNLQRCIWWCDFHKRDNDDEGSQDCDKDKEKELDWRPYHNADELPSWDEHFFESIFKEEVFDLIMAADYLEIQGLLNNTSKFIANMMRGKSSDAIRATFDIENDFNDFEVRRRKVPSKNWMDDIDASDAAEWAGETSLESGQTGSCTKQIGMKEEETTESEALKEETSSRSRNSYKIDKVVGEMIRRIQKSSKTFQ